MWSGISSSVAIVAYLALFAGVAIVFLFANLVVGWFVRPSNPHEEKLEIYECGEPTIGSSFVQFDLRFYVVALLFIIFDVEVAFFFPWATVFGKSTHLMRSEFAVVEGTSGASGNIPTGSNSQAANLPATSSASANSPGGTSLALTADGEALYREFGIRNPRATAEIPVTLQYAVPVSNEVQQANDIAHAGGRQLALVSIVDILVFFGVLIIGFLYVWHRGDLDWVRAAATAQGAKRSVELSGDVPGGLADNERVLSL